MQFSFLPASDTYQTLAKPCQSEYKEKNSRFIAYGLELSHEQKLKSALEMVKKLFPKASHYCYAYRLGLDGNQYRANDDGEPSGTAGRPILNQIDAAQLTNILVVVVRYYGGINLGVSGLKEAYKISTRQALQTATIQTKILTQSFLIQTDYLQMPAVMNWLKTNQLTIIDNNFTDVVQISVEVRLAFINSFLSYLETVPNLEVSSLLKV